MFSVGWRAGQLCTRLVRKSAILLTPKMGNCSDKMPKVSPTTKMSKVVCQEDELQEGDLVRSKPNPVLIKPSTQSTLGTVRLKY